MVRTNLVTATAIAAGQVPVHLAQKPGGKVAGLLNAERLMVAKQLEQHFSMNGAATGAVLDSKVTGAGTGWQEMQTLLHYYLSVVMQTSSDRERA